jgi:hypothetical protein
MLDPALVAVGVGAGVAALVGGLVAYERRRAAARDAEMARLAVQRGWRYQLVTERGQRIERFQGTSLAGPWTLEVADIRARRRGPRRLLRWSDGDTASAAPPDQTAVVFLLPTGGHARPFDLLASGGLAGQLAGTLIRRNLAQVFVHAFGDGSLAGRELEMVKPSVPLVDYVVFCERKADALRRITPGFASALQRAFGDAWRGRGLERPWITLAGDRVALACSVRHTPDVTLMAAVIDAGSILGGVRE